MKIQDFNPISPYAISKLFAYLITKNYREAYGIFACNGILFNHESKRRGGTFVTRKITSGVADIIVGKDKYLVIGNLNAKRDWGHAKDYVEMQWKMLQQRKPDDYVIATGKQTSVREFINKCFNYCGVKLSWQGKGLFEVAKILKINTTYKNNLKKGDIVVKVDKRYCRPSELNNLNGNSFKAIKKLNWQPNIKLDDLIKEMMESDLEESLLDAK